MTMLERWINVYPGLADNYPMRRYAFHYDKLLAYYHQTDNILYRIHVKLKPSKRDEENSK